MLAAFLGWLSQYIVPVVLGYVARHIQEWVKDYLQAKKTQAAVDETKNAKTPAEEDKSAKDMANNY